MSAGGERRRVVVAIVVALVALSAAIITIAWAGRVSPPALDALNDDPDPAIHGALALLTDDERCLVVVDASGGHSRVWHCEDGLTRLGWIDDSTVWASAWHDSGLEQVIEVDLRANEVTVRVEDVDRARRRVRGHLDDSHDERRDGSRVVLRHDPPRIAVYDPEGRLRNEALLDGGGRAYRLTGVTWSPDGRWILVRDSANRLLVADDDLEVLRVLAEDVRDAVWRDVESTRGP